MKNFLPSLFVFLLLLISSGGSAADFFWVGGSGQFQDPAHWSTVSGGQGGAGIPGASDHVHFDDHSFFSSKDKVVFPASITIHSFSYTASNHRAMLVSAPSSVLRINGNWICTAAFRNYLRGSIEFFSAQNQVLQTANVHFRAHIKKTGTGTLTLQSNDLELEPGCDLTISSGTFQTSGKGIRADHIVFPHGDPMVFDAAGSTLFTIDPINTYGADITWNRPLSEEIIVQVPQSDGVQLRASATCGTPPNQFTITATVTSNYSGQHVSCNGANDATVCVNVVGGLGPFQLQWLGGGPSTACWTGLGAGTYTIRVIDTGPNPDVICATTVTVVEPGDLTVLSWTTTNPTCNNICDGTATPFVFGGTPNYNYVWSSGETSAFATQLCIGLNSLSVTDANGCNFDTTFFILIPTAILPNLTVTDASCFGVCDGQITSNPTGGNGAPYTYLWSNGQTTQTITGLCDGSYSVTVFDANGCPQAAGATVNEPLPIVITLTNQTNLICNSICSGSLTVSASQGTAPYTYQWFSSPSNTALPGQTNPTATGLCAGSYYVVVTDAGGCIMQSSTFTLTQPTAITSGSSASPALCHNGCSGSLTINAAGGTPPFSYQWINAATGNPIGSGSPLNGVCPGTYYAQITDGNGCIVNSTPPVTVVNPPALALVVDPEPTVCHGDCNGSASVTSATGGTGALSVSWLTTGLTLLGNGNSITGLCAGSYVARVTDANNCTYDTTFVIDEPAPYNYLLSTTNVTCVGTCNGTATLAGITGENAPYSIDWSSSANTSPTENGLCAGNYSVTIIDSRGCDTIIPFTIGAPPALNLSPAFSDPTCSGLCNGTASANPTGGTGAYTYTWTLTPSGAALGQSTDTVTGLCDGNYQVVVIDANGCTQNANFSLTDPLSMVATAVGTSSNCGICDGTTSVSVVGGTAPFTVVWFNNSTGVATGSTSNPATSVCSGTYYAVVTDANGCNVNSDTANVFDNVIITASGVPTNPSCFGFCDGGVDLTVSGGNPPYTFVWFDQNTGLPIGQSAEDPVGLCEGDYFVTITDQNGCSPPDLLFSLTQPNALTATPSSTNPNCATLCNGIGSVNPIGGTTPYSYSWVDNATGTVVGTTQTVNTLCDGSYSITVTDANGCSFGPQIITLTDPPAIDATLTSTDATCFNVCNGTASVVATGGTAPYNFNWSSSGNTTSNETGLCDGNYTVSLTDANGCPFGPINFTITEPLAFTANVTGGSVLCFGDCNGSASVTANGGTAPYSYQWNAAAGSQTTPVASSLCAGNYSVTVTDANGCSVGPLNTSITQPATAVSGTTSVTPASCSGTCNGTATATGSGGTAPYTYQWNDPLNQTTQTAINLCSGNYTVTITDANGCTFSPAPVNVTEPSVLSLTASATSALCNGSCDGTATVVITGGSPPFSIEWNDPAAQTGLTATALCAGNYSVTVTDINGCTGTASVTVNEPTAITASTSSVQATCGICDGSATVNPSGGTGTLNVQWDAAAANQTTTTATALCAGAYIATITDGNGCSVTQTVPVSNITGEVLTLTSTDVSCNGVCDGTVNVTFNCVDAPCSLVWNDPSASTSNTVTGLCAGTYAATVTNNSGCITVATVDVNEPLPLQANLSSTDVLCFGDCNGTGISTPSGGTAPYTYQWNAAAANQTTSTAFNLCPGTYAVTVTDANGCTDGGSVTVGEPTLLTANVTSANASCNNVCDATGTVFPSGGTAPYTYAWDDPSSQTTQSANNLCAGSYNVTLVDNNGCTVGPLSITVTEPTAIDVSTTFTTLDCNGDCDGTITSTVTGGTAPYTYTWNDPLAQTTSTATNLCAGTFTLNVTDVNGCPGGPVSVSLSEPTAITSTFAYTQPDCNGDCNGSIVSNVSGGTLPYTYVWNDPSLTSTPFVSNLCAGNYDLTVTDANGCVTSIAAVLTEPAVLDANLSSTNINCFGNCNGTATAAPSGGTAPYTYSWTTGATSSNIFSLCPGVYGVTVTDANGCLVSDSRNIVEPTEIVLSTASSNSTCGVCNGSISVSPSGGSPGYNYLWSPSAGSQTTQAATGLCSGLYFVTVTDATGCSVSATVGLSDNGAETIAMSSTDALCFGSCNGTATATTACVNVPCSFIWYNGSTGAILPGQTNATATGLCDGFYQVEVINGLGCSSFDTITIEEPDQMISNATATNVDCFGNCNGTLSANATGGTGVISYQWDAAAGSATTANVTGLCAGTFVVTMTDALGCTEDETLTITQPTQLLATVSSTDVLCNGDCTGTGTATISGGTVPYTIAWNDPSSQNTSTAVNLCAGNFSVNITDANGCPVSGNITVNEPTLLSANVTTTPNLCNGDCTGTATANPSGGNSPYSFVWNDPALQTTATANGLCTGTYQVVVVDASGCATSPLNAAITDPSTVTFTATVNDVSCNASCNGSIVISASGGDGNYLYSINGGTSFQVSNTFNGLCSGAYTVVVQDGNLCASVPQNVNVNEPTAITANTSFFPADCNVSNGAATAVPSGGTTGYTYVWYDAALVALGQNTQTAINLGAGVYVVDITDANGCVEQVSVTVSNTNAPSTTAVVTDASCFGQCNGAIDVTTSGGLAPYSWSWLPGGESTEDLSNLCAGGYIVETTDANGCISFGNYTVNEPTSIAGTFVTADAACGQCNGTASFNASGGTGTLAYAWSNGQLVQAATGLCAGAYMVQVTDANGCVQTFNTSINNIGGPTSETIVQNDVSCFGVCDGDATITPVGGTAPYTYYWVHNGATTNTLTGMCAGTYFMEVTDSLGCVRVSNVTINEPTEMTDSTVLFAATCGLCDGGLSVFVSGGTTPYNYQWDVAAGAATTSLVNGLCEGIYVLVVTDANGCRDTIVQPVNGATAPQTVVTPVNVTCEGQCDGSASAAITLGTAPYTSTWLDDLGNPIGQTGTSATALCEGDYFVQVVDAVGCTSFEAFTITEPDSLMFSLPFTQDPSCFNTCDGIGVAIVISGTLPYTFSWNDPASQITAAASGLCSGTYTVTVTDGNGCSNAQQVTIDQPLPITLALDSTDASCSTVPDGAIDATPGGGAGGFTFSWSGPSGFTAVTEDITNILTGWYFLTVTDANGCSLTDSIFVGAVLVVDANAGNDTVICGGAASGIVLTGSGGITYEWYDLTGTLLSSTSQVTVTPAIPTSYILVANNNGCIDRDTINISINPTPVVDAGPDVQLILGNSTTIGGSPTTSAGNTVVWTPSVYLDDPNIFNPISTPDSSTTYIVSATDANGCVGYDTMRVFVFPDISFPNGFSPNGDGLNDTWIIDLIDMFPNCTVEIYNRWGQLLFLSNGYLVPWDGTYNNQPVPVGTYYYIINLNHPLYPDAFTGPLTVLR